jgi:MBG domain (YGX type)
LAVGTHTLETTFTPSDASNYLDAVGSVQLTVNRSPLMVAARDATKILGAPNPSFGGSFTGFVFSASPSVLEGALMFTTTATTESGVGRYPITASGVSSK